MKRRACCRKMKGEEVFNWRWEGLGIRQSICRTCQAGDRKDWYDRHTETEKGRTRAIKKKSIEEAGQFVYEYLSNSTCADCGEYDFSVLTFDHVRRKKNVDLANGFTRLLD